MRLYWPRHADVAQLARASACHAEGRGFESHHPLFRKSWLSVSPNGTRLGLGIYYSPNNNSAWRVYGSIFAPGDATLIEITHPAMRPSIFATKCLILGQGYHAVPGRAHP